MARCLELASQAAEAGEIPVGAVLVQNGIVIAESANRSIELNDPTGHAEILCLRQAAAATGNYRIPGAILYSSLEPCLMCAGAMLHARIGRLIYAASEPRGGCVGSLQDLLKTMNHLHPIEVDCGYLAAESAALVQAFFRDRRDT